MSLLTVFLVTGCSSKQNKSTIVVGVDTTFPPFETQEHIKLKGFDIDLIKAIAKAQGLKVTFKKMQFTGIIPGLQSGALDAAVAGMTITQARMQVVNFSHAYYHSGLSILVPNHSNIRSVVDLRGKIVATKKGTSSVTYLRKQVPEVRKVLQFDNIDDAYNVLAAGGADAVLFDNPVNLNYIKQKLGYKVVGGLLTGEYYGIAVSKNNTALLNAINHGLSTIQQNGIYDKIYHTYFLHHNEGKVKSVITPAKAIC